MHTTLGGEPLKYGEWYWYVTPEFKVIKVQIQGSGNGLLDSDVEFIYLIDDVGNTDLTKNEPMSLFPVTKEGYRRAVFTAITSIHEYLWEQSQKLKPFRNRLERLNQIAHRLDMEQ